MTLFAFAFALVIGGILWHSVELSSVATLQSRIDALKPVLTGLRLGLIALVAIVWPYLVSGLQHWGRLDEAQATILHVLRWRVVTWLVVIEVILGQNLLGQVVAMWQGSRA